MGQLLKYKFNPPVQKNNQDDHEYMVTDFIEELRKVFKDGGYTTINNNEESAGTFLVGYKGVLYEVDSDYQVGIPAFQYSAVGSGGPIALGSLFTSRGSPSDRILTSLEAASHLNPYVRPPFHILKL